MTRHCGFAVVRPGLTMTYSNMEAKLRQALMVWQWGYEVHQVHSSYATGDIWKCRSYLAERHILVVSAGCSFHDPFCSGWWIHMLELSHWGVEKLERWRWKERIMRCLLSQEMVLVGCFLKSHVLDPFDDWVIRGIRILKWYLVYKYT